MPTSRPSEGAETDAAAGEDVEIFAARGRLYIEARQRELEALDRKSFGDIANGETLTIHWDEEISKSANRKRRGVPSVEVVCNLRGSSRVFDVEEVFSHAAKI